VLFVASEYLASQLACSLPQVVRRRLAAMNILDSESKISPLSNPAWHLAGFVKAAELLRFGSALVVGWTA
jgi:hypothetical protein